VGVRGRPDLHVVARFLDALAAGPRSRSALQRAVGLNYDIFRRYLGLLVERGQVEVVDEEVRLTPMGIRLRAELLEWLRRLFGDHA
jgi:predicted transcriptional regulator